MKKHTHPVRARRNARNGVSRRSFIKGSGGLGLVLAAGVAPPFIRHAGASSLRDVSFMLPWLFVGGHSFEFAAAQTSWKDRGLNVSIVRGYGSGAACKAISAGQAMFSETSYGVMVNGIAGGLDNVGIGAKIQKSPIGISCRKDTGIKTPNDLEGHSLVQAAASGDAVMWPGFVRAAGIDESKVEVINVHPSKLVSTVLNKQADCAGVYYVSNAAALSHRAEMINFLYADYGLQTLDLGLIAQKSMLKKEPTLVQDMVDGAMEALKMQLLEPEKTLDYMIEARPELKTKPRELLLTQLGNTNFLCPGPAVEKNGLGWMDPEDQERTRDLVIKYMQVKDVPPIEEMFTNEYVGNVKLTADEWAKAKAWAAKYDPSRA